MGLPELFVAVLVAGLSCINASLPTGAYLRSHDGRFLILAGANGALALLGALWTWGEAVATAPSWTVPPLLDLALVLLAAGLLLVSTLWPRHV